MKEFNIDQYDEITGVSPDGKFYRVKPETDERIYAKDPEQTWEPAKLLRRLTTCREQAL